MSRVCDCEFWTAGPDVVVVVVVFFVVFVVVFVFVFVIVFDFVFVLFLFCVVLFGFVLFCFVVFCFVLCVLQAMSPFSVLQRHRFLLHYPLLISPAIRCLARRSKGHARRTHS
jgi:hypothetical protein